MNLDHLIAKTRKGYCLARPTLSVFLYSDVPVHQLGPHAAAAIEAYIQFIGADVLKVCVGNNGELRPLTARKVAKDLKQLRQFPAELAAAWIEYDADPQGWVGDFGLLLYATNFAVVEHGPSSDNLLRLDFPAAFAEQIGIDAFIDFLLRLVKLFPIESGNAGLTFKRTSWTEGTATEHVNRLLPRYLAFDPCYQDVQQDLRGRTTWAHWINLLGAGLAQGLGGTARIAAALPGADVRELPGGGCFIRNAMRPPVGDVNRQAPDIGLMPACARLLQPTRVRLTGLGDPEFEPEPWLARFDAMPARDWNPA
ncbi:MAG: DUF3396 domain-containing protein [Aquabacterium sp.]|uniref:type VI immunity family protein n=1 Tax=Aquabacterium sp. TaxID=1872578 RepID=UPI0025C1AF71|nr:type VI immunity family protein [Aquabacterium sp.]MBI3380498.1 DUF3396 domain-containing protein [Aquabacterium sp.]